jgi:hypothetical protein
MLRDVEWRPARADTAVFAKRCRDANTALANAFDRDRNERVRNGTHEWMMIGDGVYTHEAEPG